ncbi:nucleotidyltransferase family protein [Rhodococcus triatomae]|nr:nucleotidyltransferase family protein [Rhodococcus triatomae]QNG25761.1 nucleotidyltransferase family protein [Rhodococcus triatomae]
MCGIVLAAGAGRRFGAPKAGIVFEGRTLAERAAALLLGGGCDDVVVVTGALAQGLRLHSSANLHLVHNPLWNTGMASSLRAGLDAAAERGADAAVLTLVDLPWIGPEAVRRVIARHREGASVVAATYDGRRGHPILFARKHFADVAASAQGDSGARRFLAAHPTVADVDCTDTGRIDDVDVPADLPGP